MVQKIETHTPGEHELKIGERQAICSGLVTRCPNRPFRCLEQNRHASYQGSLSTTNKTIMPMMKTRTIVQLVLGKLVGISLGSVADYYFGRKPATPLTFGPLTLHCWSFLSGLCGRSDDDHGSDAFYVHLLIT